MLVVKKKNKTQKPYCFFNTVSNEINKLFMCSRLVPDARVYEFQVCEKLGANKYNMFVDKLLSN